MSKLHAGLVAVALLTLLACARQQPLSTTSAETGHGGSQRDDLVTSATTGSCGFLGAVIQSGDSSYRPCGSDLEGELTCSFIPEQGEVVQLQVFSRDGGTVTVDYSQAFNGTSASFQSGQTLPLLTVTDGSDGRTDCIRAVVYGLDPADPTRLGCRITLQRTLKHYGHLNCR